MSYTLTNVQAGSYTKGRQGNAITTIIVHWWGDPANHPTFDGTVSYFAKGGNKTSAHYVVEAGKVCQMVSDNDTAYQAGNWAMNLKSIGIECNPRATDADKATVAELIINLRKVHGNIPIIGHRDVVATDCPGAYYPPIETLAPWLNPKPVPSVQTTVKESNMGSLIFMQTYDNDVNKVWLISPGNPPKWLSGEEWGYCMRLGATLPGSNYNEAQVAIINALINPPKAV